jgi:hypothetical protein
MDAREQMQRWIAWVAQHVDEVESSQIKSDIDLFTGMTGRLAGELASRNTMLARQSSRRKAKPPKAAPASGPQKPKQPQSNDDTPKAQNDAEARSQRVSGIQQGIRQATPPLKAQRQRLRNRTYGQPSQERSFLKAAKAIAS